jgi:hypothetical protein
VRFGHRIRNLLELQGKYSAMPHPVADFLPHLQVADATPAEAARGMAMLNTRQVELLHWLDGTGRMTRAG